MRVPDPYTKWMAALNIAGIIASMFVLYISTTMKGRDKHFRLYSKMVVVQTVVDLALGCEELFCLHALLMREGIIFIFPRGPELSLLGTNWIAVTGFIHAFVSLLANILPAALFHFRYSLAVHSGTTGRILARNLAIVGGYALLLSVLATVAESDSRQRPAAEYTKVLEDYLETFGNADEMYAMDLRDASAQLFLCFALLGTNTAMFVICRCVYRTYRFLDSQTTSTRAKRLQRQFTLYLVTQTLCSAAFAMGPIGAVAFGMCIGKTLAFTGLLMTTAAVPLVNAVLSLSMVAAYRDRAMQILRFIGQCGRVETQTTPKTVSMTRTSLTLK